MEQGQLRSIQGQSQVQSQVQRQGQSQVQSRYVEYLPSPVYDDERANHGQVSINNSKVDHSSAVVRTLARRLEGLNLPYVKTRMMEPSIIYITIEPYDINVCIDFARMDPAATTMVLDFIISNFEYLSMCSTSALSSSERNAGKNSNTNSNSKKEDHGKWSMFINGSFSRVLESANVQVLKGGAK
jgi:hypothetical protein